MKVVNEVRLDKWLWATRLFRTRSLAIEGCRAGHVKVGGQRAKPAHQVKAGEVLTVQTGELIRTVKVIGLLEQRVSASLVPEYLQDLTAPEEYEQARTQRVPPPVFRPKGSGRPTKKQRRLMELTGLLPKT